MAQSKKKIRFLATGDFHSDMEFVNSIKERIDLDTIDFVLFTGDLSERRDDFKDLFGIFEGKQIFMVPGNHEGKKQLDILQEKYKVHLVGNAPVKFNDDLVLFGTNYLSIGPYGISEQDVFENMVANFQAIEDVPCKIHMSHIPPSDTEIGEMSPYPFIGGSEASKAFLEHFNPDITICGHIHESSGLEEIVNKTKLVNVGKTVKVLEFDPEKKKVEVKDK